MINPLKTSAAGRAAYRLGLWCCAMLPLPVRPSPDRGQLSARAAEAMRVCRQAGFSPSYCLLADMSLHSGLKRMAVWDYGTGRVLLRCLVSHGSGSESTRGLDSTRSGATLSGIHGSLLTPPGVFRVAERYTGRYGVSFRLDGLQPFNASTRSRAVVLHAYKCIPEFSIFPHGVAESAGCPAVSPRTVKRLERLGIENNAAMYIFQ